MYTSGSMVGINNFPYLLPLSDFHEYLISRPAVYRTFFEENTIQQRNLA
jgi:hypothetical protein